MIRTSDRQTTNEEIICEKMDHENEFKIKKANIEETLTRLDYLPMCKI